MSASAYTRCSSPQRLRNSPGASADQSVSLQVGQHLKRLVVRLGPACCDTGYATQSLRARGDVDTRSRSKRFATGRTACRAPRRAPWPRRAATQVARCDPRRESTGSAPAPCLSAVEAVFPSGCL